MSAREHQDAAVWSTLTALASLLAIVHHIAKLHEHPPPYPHQPIGWWVLAGVLVWSAVAAVAEFHLWQKKGR